MLSMEQNCFILFNNKNNNKNFEIFGMRACVCVRVYFVFLLPLSNIRLISWCLVCSVKDYLSNLYQLCAHWCSFIKIYIEFRLWETHRHTHIMRARAHAYTTWKIVHFLLRVECYKFYNYDFSFSFSLNSYDAYSLHHIPAFFISYVRTHNAHTKFELLQKNTHTTRREKKRCYKIVWMDAECVCVWDFFLLLFLERHIKTRRKFIRMQLKMPKLCVFA